MAGLVRALVDFDAAIESLNEEIQDDYSASYAETALDACADTLRKVAIAFEILPARKSHEADPLWMILRRLPRKYRSAEQEVGEALSRFRGALKGANYDGELSEEYMQEADYARSVVHDALRELWNQLATDIEAKMEGE